MVNIHLGFGRGKTVAVVDVSPGGASVAIITCSKDSAATVLASAASALSLEKRTEDQEKGLIGEQVREAAERALKLYSAAGHQGAVTEAHVIVHAPWTHSQFLIAEEKHEEETRVQDAMISVLAKKSLGTASEIDMRNLLEGSVIQVALNGYPTPDPAGKYAHELRVTSIASDCDPGVRSAVSGAVQQAFPVAQIVWRTGLRSLMTLARESHLDKEFLIIDMGGDDTHIAAYRGGLMDQLVVPEGTRTLLARLASAQAPEATISLLRMVSRDACSSDTCDALKQAMAAAEPELVRVFGESIAKIATKNRVPNDVLLVTHPDLESWLAEFLTRIDFAQFTVTSLPLTVHTAAKLDISKWVAGAQNSDATTVGAALVNIECRV